MANTKQKSIKNSIVKSDSELLVKEFYNLRKAFEEGYSGKLRSCKYEETREFTISLNHAIFQANQLSHQKPSTSNEMVILKNLLKDLKKDLKNLKLSN